MQEQHPYKITPDQAWGKMRPILDEAMPVKPATRRLPFVWWSVSTVVVAAVMGLLLFNGESITADLPLNNKENMISPSTESHPSLKVDQHNSSAPSMNSIETGKVPVTATESTSTQSAPSSLKQQKATSPKAKTSNTSVNPGKTNANEKALPMAMTEDPISDTQAIPVTSQVEDENTAIATEDRYNAEEFISGIETLYDETLRDAQVLEPLPQISASSIDVTAQGDQILTGESIKDKHKPSFIEPNIAISGLAGLNGGLGTSAAIGANLNVGKHIAFTTSAGYLTYNPNSFLQGRLESLDANAEYNWIVNYDPAITGNETYVAAENVNNMADYNAINPLVDKITQWSVSAGLKWKVTPRFFTEGGVQFGFNTRAYSQYPIINFDPLSTPSSGAKINNSLDEYDVIRSSTTSLYLGIGYRFSPHFDVFTNWTHGLHPYILNDTSNAISDLQPDERTDYIRGLNVGLRYTL